MKSLSHQRFDALAGYIRSAHTVVTSTELEWLADDSERVLGVLVLDNYDDDFGGVVLGRDQKKKFRAISVTQFSDSIDTARAVLKQEIRDWSHKPDSEFWQRDETGTPVDVFLPVVAPARMSPAFLRIATAEAFRPARSLIESMMPYFEDVDGNFVEQFQSAGFDARFWELYLFATLNEQRFVFDRSYNAPDYLCMRQDVGQVFVEAVTVNPTTNGAGVVIEPAVPTDPTLFKQYYQEYMPIKWGSPLTSKLKKGYWNLAHVRDNPLVLAVQDFHIPRAMTFLSHSITAYLYGISFTTLYDATGKLHVTAAPRGPHHWGMKTIETGFFNLPGSEYISAVVTNPTATISKFNRMAHVSGFGSPNVQMVCEGFCHHHDDNASISKPFRFHVNSPGYSESWIQGLNVFHNPRAVIPLDDDIFFGAAHHRYENGVVRSKIPDFHPYQSQTRIFVSRPLLANQKKFSIH